MDWARSRAAVAGVVVGLGLVVVGAFAGRPDVAVLGAAPVVAGFWDWRRRPSSVPSVRVDASSDGPVAGTLRVDAVVVAPGPMALVGVRRGLQDLVEVLVTVDGSRRLPVAVHTVRTGPQEVAIVDVQGIGPGAASVSEASAPSSRTTLVLPAPRPLGDLRPAAPAARSDRRARVATTRRGRRPARRAPVRARRPAAPHRLARHGPARPRPARALRRGASTALAEAVVMLVVDSRDEVGPDPMTWRGSTLPASAGPDLARPRPAGRDVGRLRVPLPR